MGCQHGNDPETCSWCVHVELDANGNVRESLRLAFIERERVERWHATYNAALNGLLAGPKPEWVESKRHWCHEGALLHADLAHGPLVKP
jgi:hypothetical protein